MPSSPVPSAGRDEHRRRRIRRHALAVAVLMGVAVAPAVGAVREREADLPVAAVAAATVHVPAAARATADDGRATRDADAGPDRVGPVLPAFTHRSARLEDVSRTPVALRIDALDLSAPVLATGRSTDGQLDVPPDAGTVVWYRSGSVPGAAGSAVLAAHVDYDGRPGAFYALDRLRPGDTAQVEFDDGSSLTFEVFERTRYRKRVLPITELFTRNGDALLTLVTCGGQFNETTRRYDSNTVVRATLPDLK